MRNRFRVVAVLLSAGLLALGCQFEAGTEPGEKNPPAMSSVIGQCLVPPSAEADSRSAFLSDGPLGSTLIRSGLASRLRDGPGEILCLAPEGARWVLRWEGEP